MTCCPCFDRLHQGGDYDASLFSACLEQGKLQTSPRNTQLREHLPSAQMTTRHQHPQPLCMCDINLDRQQTANRACASCFVPAVQCMATCILHAWSHAWACQWPCPRPHTWPL